MASEIPEDIRELASSIVAEIDADWSYDGQAPRDSERRAIDEATIAIAKALLAERQATNQRWKDLDETARESGLLLDPLDVAEAVMTERERCRLIAAGFDDGSDSGFSLAARTIERIIRQDNPNEQDERYRALAEMHEEAKKLGLE